MLWLFVNNNKHKQNYFTAAGRHSVCGIDFKYIIFTALFSLVYNDLKLGISVLTKSCLNLHVSTVALSEQSKHRLCWGPFVFRSCYSTSMLVLVFIWVYVTVKQIKQPHPVRPCVCKLSWSKTVLFSVLLALAVVDVHVICIVLMVVQVM